MQIKILFDEAAVDSSLHTGWGVSFLIDGKVLFDTGENGEWLFANMKQLKVDMGKIGTVVISHDHWDHQGGLWKILEINPNLKLYTCPNFSRGFKENVETLNVRLIEQDKFAQISEGIYTTGEIENRCAFRYMPEQALVLKTPKGITVLTGCAHPGIIKVIEDVKKNIPGDIYLVLGGFHLITTSKGEVKKVVDSFKQLGVRNVAPTHCTGKIAVDLFKEAYGEDFIEVKVGQAIEV